MVVLAILCFMVPCSQSWAAKAYVTDSFRISLRRGPSIENKILRFIPSGLPVKINETQDGWSHIRLLEAEDGILEGWVLSRYLVKRLPWEVQANRFKEESGRLKEKLARIDDKWASTIKDERNYTQELKKKYEVAQREVQRLSEENEILKSSQRNKWFTTGGLVLLSGLLVGLLVGKPPKRRRLSF
jgi:SH3 domain protein